MKKKLIPLLLLPLISLPQAGRWAMDFDEDFAAAPSRAWTPVSIAGCLGWWDASDLATITTNSSGFISQWNDKSGNNNHAVQTTENKKCSIDGGKINGLSTVKCSSRISGPTYFDLTIPLSWTNGFSFLFVCHRIPGENTYILGVTGGYTEYPFWWYSDGAQYGLGDGLFLPGVSDILGNYIVSIVFSGTLSTAYINGVGIGTIEYSNSASGPFDILCAGVYDTLLCENHSDVGEVIYYSTPLSTANRQAVESYLGTKWGITITP